MKPRFLPLLALVLATAPNIALSSPISFVSDLDNAQFIYNEFDAWLHTDGLAGGQRPGTNFTISPTTPQQILVTFADNESILATDTPPYDFQERVGLNMDMDYATYARTYQLKIALTDQAGNQVTPFSQSMNVNVGAGVGNVGTAFPFNSVGTLITMGGLLEFSGFLVDLSSTSDTFNLVNPRIMLRFQSDTLSRQANVPEPHPLALLGLGLTGLALARRRASASIAIRVGSRTNNSNQR